jgi:hypothetical protein
MVRRPKRQIAAAWFVQRPEALETLRQRLRERFPNLHAIVREGVVELIGSLPILHEGKELDRYSLRIALADNHPFGPAKVFETALRIPREADKWHVNPDGSLCIGVPEQVWPSSKRPLDIAQFLDGPVRTFLLRNSLIAMGGEWTPGEWAHGAAGIIDFYARKLDVSDRQALVQCMEHIAALFLKGHWDCPCGSGKRLRNCHGPALRECREQFSEEAVIYSLSIVRRS